MSSNELDVNRNLINPDFDSYRLRSNTNDPWSLESISFDDYGHVQTLELGQEDYSFVHLSMVTNINNLYHDPESPLKLYFITQKGLVVGLNQKSQKLKKLFQIPDYDFQNTFASMAFQSACVLILRSKKRQNDGETLKYSLDLLIIERTFEDHTSETWNLNQNDIFNIDIKSILYKDLDYKQSSHMYLFNTGSASSNLSLSFIFGSINEQLSTSNDTNQDTALKSRFRTILHWFILENKENKVLLNYRRLIENGIKFDWPKYLALVSSKNNDQDVIVVSEGRMKFSNVIQNGIQLPLVEDKIPQIPCSNDSKVIGNFIQKSSDDEKLNNYSLDYEECDQTDFYGSLVMTHFNGNNGDIHLEYQSSSFYQWICTIPNLSRNKPPLFVIRHDVDAFIYEVLVGQESKAKHVGVFDALGYIQASKTKKRFITIGGGNNHQSSTSNHPDWYFAVIAESEQNVYIYWKEKVENGKQTTTRKCQNGHHKFVQLSDGKQNSIQGLYASSSTIFVLTNDRLYLMKYNKNQ